MPPKEASFNSSSAGMNIYIYIYIYIYTFATWAVHTTKHAWFTCDVRYTMRISCSALLQLTYNQRAFGRQCTLPRGRSENPLCSLPSCELASNSKRRLFFALLSSDQLASSSLQAPVGNRGTNRLKLQRINLLRFHSRVCPRWAASLKIGNIITLSRLNKCPKRTWLQNEENKQKEYQSITHSLTLLSQSKPECASRRRISFPSHKTQAGKQLRKALRSRWHLSVTLTVLEALPIEPTSSEDGISQLSPGRFRHLRTPESNSRVFHEI